MTPSALLVAMSAAVLLIDAGAAVANPPAPSTNLEVEGSCPSRDQVETALVGEEIAIVAGDAEWQVRISSSLDGTAVLEISHLRRSDHSLRRLVTSADCAAIADTFALITESHLRAVPPQAAPTPAASASPTPAAAPGMLPAPPTSSSSPARALRRELSVGLSAGLDSGLAPEMSMGFAQLDLGTTLRRRYRARLTIAADRAITYSSAAGSIVRQQTSLRVEVGRRLQRSRLWLQPMLGAGLVVSNVEVDLGDDRGVRRLHPTATGSLLAGVALGSGVSLRAELGGQLYPIADTYVSVNRGAVGESPRATIGIALGLQVDTGW